MIVVLSWIKFTRPTKFLVSNTSTRVVCEADNEISPVYDHCCYYRNRAQYSNESPKLSLVRAIYSDGMGGMNCGFTSFQQCLADVSGIGGFCTQNSTYQPSAGPRVSRFRRGYPY